MVDKERGDVGINKLVWWAIILGIVAVAVILYVVFFT